MDRDTARTLVHEVVDALWAVAEKRIASASPPDSARWETAARKVTTTLDLYRTSLTQILYGRDYDLPGDDVLLRAAVEQLGYARQLPELRARLDQLVQVEEAAIELIAFVEGPQPGVDTERLQAYEEAVARFRRDSGLPAGIADEPTETKDNDR